jgi:hypothetical protein
MALGCVNSDHREAAPGNRTPRRPSDGGDAEAPSSPVEEAEDPGLGTGKQGHSSRSTGDNSVVQWAGRREDGEGTPDLEGAEAGETQGGRSARWRGARAHRPHGRESSGGAVVSIDPKLLATWGHFESLHDFRHQE